MTSEPYVWLACLYVCVCTRNTFSSLTLTCIAALSHAVPLSSFSSLAHAQYSIHLSASQLYIILYMKTICSIAGEHGAGARQPHIQNQWHSNGIETNETSSTKAVWWLVFLHLQNSKEWMVKNRESTNKYRFEKKAHQTNLHIQSPVRVYPIRLRIQYIDSVHHRTRWHNIQTQTCKRTKNVRITSTIV